ncbi:unnamed protein product, partial [Allacma fusca]
KKGAPRFVPAQGKF